MRVLILFIIIVTISCSDSKTDVEQEKQRIIESWIDWPIKENAGDPGYYWAEDAMIMSQGQPILKGKFEIEKMIAGLHKIPGFKMEWDGRPASIEVSADGHMAFLIAKNTVQITDSLGHEIKKVNQALQIWKKDKQGNWKAAVVTMYPDTEVN